MLQISYNVHLCTASEFSILQFLYYFLHLIYDVQLKHSNQFRSRRLDMLILYCSLSDHTLDQYGKNHSSCPILHQPNLILVQNKNWLLFPKSIWRSKTEDFIIIKTHDMTANAEEGYPIKSPINLKILNLIVLTLRSFTNFFCCNYSALFRAVEVLFVKLR